MYIMDGIAYADECNVNSKKVKEIKIISNLCMLVTFSDGAKKIFDLTELVKLPAFKKLEDYEFFKSAYIEHGMIVWDNGNIDIAPETILKNSYNYEKE